MDYGVVEFNNVAAQRNGRIRAQLPASEALATAVSNKLENGMFLVYDRVDGEVKLPAAATDRVLLHKSSEKLYGEVGLKEFALDVPGKVYPRLYELASGDTFTITKFVGAFADLIVGDIMTVNSDGILAKKVLVGTEVVIFKVVEKTTVPDGRDAIKLEVL